MPKAPTPLLLRATGFVVGVLGPACASATGTAPVAPGAPSLLPGFFAGLALALGVLAASDRWDRPPLLVAGACLGWAGLLALGQAGASLTLLFHLLLGLCLVALLLHLLGRPWRRWMLGLGCVFAAAVVAGGALPPALGAIVRAQISPAIGALLLVTAAFFLWRRWRAWMREGVRSWIDIAGQLRTTVLPLLAATAVGGLLVRGTGVPLPPAAGVLLVALAASTILGFGRRRAQAQARLRQRERAMKERLAEAERHHQQLADQRLEQVTERERKRIAGDLHDDLGAKLLTIVHTSDNERISTLAREALEEMRLSVRGLTGKPVQLLDAIGDWRAEVVSRLAQSNIEVEWVSLAEDVTHTLPARAYVQTTRILREAVSNVIKHSGATRCVVRCALLDGDFQLVIQDNGRGVSAEKDGRLDKGHGLTSMKSRAKQMQGQCLVESGPGWGTLIRLTLPL